MTNFVDRENYLYAAFPGVLKPGNISYEHFKYLIELSNIHSMKIIQSLEDYFVRGIERRVICEANNVSPGYLSVKIRQLQDISRLVILMYPFYQSE